MTLRVVLHGVKQKHEIYYLNDIFVCRFDVNANCDYDFTNDSYIFRFFNVSRESINEIVETVDRQLNVFNYKFITKTEDLGFIFTMKYYASKKEDGLDASIIMPPRGSVKSYLNECFGVPYICTDIEALKQASNNYYKSKYHGGYKKRHGDIYKVNAIYNGIERATGKFKTVVKWSDGTKTIVTSQNDNHLNRTLAFAYAWVKKQYGSNSAFKRHVDKYVETWGYMGQIFFDDGDYQAQLSVRTKSNDIYDQVALVMTMKDFGGAKNVVELVEEKTFNE